MKTAFLTGGAGFVGANVARDLLAHGWRVRALVRTPDPLALLALLNPSQIPVRLSPKPSLPVPGTASFSPIPAGG